MNYKRLLIIGSVILIMLVLVIGFINRKDNRKYQKVTSNLQHSWLHGRDIYFSTGSFFAKYNLSNNQIDRLSDYLYISSGMTALSWSPESVVFQTNPQATDRDDITTAAEQLGAQPVAAHWWRYDFASKQYQLLNFANIDNCTSLIQVSGTVLACVQPQSADGQSTQLILLDTASKSAKKLASNGDSMGSISSNGNSLFYILTRLGGKQSLRSVNLSSMQDEQLYKGDGILTYHVYSGGMVLIKEVSVNQSSSENSHTEDTATASPQKIIVSKNNQILFVKKINSLPIAFYADPDDGAFISSLDGSISMTDEKGVHRVNRPTKQPLAPGDFSFKIDNKFWVLDSQNGLSSWPAVYPSQGYRPPDSYVSNKDSDPNGSWWLDTATGKNSPAGYLYLPDQPSSQQQAAVGDTLTKEGFRPSEFNFSWVVDGVDFNTPISPKAILIK